MSLKPPKYVKTLRDLIYWSYAELIAIAAGFDTNYGVVVSRYKLLKSGEMKWSSSMRIIRNRWKGGNVCTYCGSMEEFLDKVFHIILYLGPSPPSGTSHLINWCGHFKRHVWQCKQLDGLKISLSSSNLYTSAGQKEAHG